VYKAHIPDDGGKKLLRNVSTEREMNIDTGMLMCSVVDKL